MCLLGVIRCTLATWRLFGFWFYRCKMVPKEAAWKASKSSGDWGFVTIVWSVYLGDRVIKGFCINNYNMMITFSRVLLCEANTLFGYGGGDVVTKYYWFFFLTPRRLSAHYSPYLLLVIHVSFSIINSFYSSALIENGPSHFICV